MPDTVGYTMSASQTSDIPTLLVKIFGTDRPGITAGLFATLAAYSTDEFIWGPGWSGHRLVLGVRGSDGASSHVIGQLQKF